MLTFNEFFESVVDSIMDLLAESDESLTEAKEIRMAWPKNPYGETEVWKEIEAKWVGGDMEATKKLMNDNWGLVQPLVDEGLKQFQSIVKKAIGEPTRAAGFPLGKKDFRQGVIFTAQSKRPEKAINKATERGKKSTNPLELGDLIRGAILVDSPTELNGLIKNLKRKLDVIQYEEKRSGEDPALGYYGSHHFDILLPNGMIAELQVMTKRLWKYKEEGHKFYELVRSNVDPETGKMVVKKDIEVMSKNVFKLGNKPKSSSFKALQMKRSFKGM